MFLHFIGVIIQHYSGHDYIYGLIPLFDVNEEANIPTFYSTVALLFATALLSIIAISHRRNGSAYKYWVGLAIIFLFISIDEFASIHELLSPSTRETLHTSGLLHFAWVIPYGIAFIAFGIAYLKFLIRLPKDIMILFIISGAVFISGAIGFEMISAKRNEIYGYHEFIFLLYGMCEEFLEMLGVALFIYTLLTYIAKQFKSVTISINEPQK